MVQALSNASRVGYSSFTFRSHNQILGLTSVVQNGCRFFPANYFGMSIRSRTFSPKTFSCVDLERRALLDHAAMCRRVAGEISHANAVNKLTMMAQEYEARARSLELMAREAEIGPSRIDEGE